MGARQTSAAIDAEAAGWAARVDDGPLSTEEQAALDAWLAADARRLGAYAKARAVFAHVGRARALGPAYDAAEFASPPPPAPPRAIGRRAIWMGAAAAGVAGIGVTLGLQARAGVRTKVGEVRLAPLPDGSSMTLNTDSRVTVDFSRRERRIRLHQGEAMFEVAKDASRPFLVDAGDTEVRAVGASFVVCRLDDRPVQVLVRDGLVEMRRPAAAPVRVAANSRAEAAGEAIRATALTPAEVDREISWREGLLAFEDMPLEDAVAEYARYSETRIVIDDPALRRETVTGLFMANNPTGFAHAVADALELKTDVSGREVRLYR